MKIALIPFFSVTPISVSYPFFPMQVLINSSKTDQIYCDIFNPSHILDDFSPFFRLMYEFDIGVSSTHISSA